MKAVNIYLMFNGNCRPAFEFYKQVLGGDLVLFKYSDAPPEARQAGAEDHIMHAALKNSGAILMGSDCPPQFPVKEGANFQVSISCNSNEEVDKFTHAMAAGGKIVMPPGETFYAHRCAMCADKFGIHWMFINEKPMQPPA